MRLRVLAATVVLALTMTACGDSGSKSDLPELSATPSVKPTTGTPLDRVPQSPPEAPKNVQSKAGAETFSAYVVAMIFYTIATNDIDALFGIADKNLCASCDNIRKDMDKRPSQIQVTDKSTAVSDGKVVAQEGGFYTVTQNLNIPSGNRVDKKTGKVYDTMPGNDVQPMDVNLQWRKGVWVLLNYSFPDKKASA